jgi:ABC-2 type transport system permease protein
MLFGVFAASAFLFTGITSEKQQHVTEQIVAAIGPQALVDGKILGLSLLALQSVFGQLLASLAGLGLAAALVDFAWPLPPLGAVLLELPVWDLTALFGFAFWATFVGAVAATIDNPQTSSRSGFLMLPILPMGIAFLGLGAPDAGWYQALAYLPPTAPPVLMVRALVDVAAPWELPISLALTGLTVAGLRRVVGKCFATTLLLRGSEPSLAEIWRTLRST